MLQGEPGIIVSGTQQIDRSYGHGDREHRLKRDRAIPSLFRMCRQFEDSSGDWVSLAQDGVAGPAKFFIAQEDGGRNGTCGNGHCHPAIPGGQHHIFVSRDENP